MAEAKTTPLSVDANTSNWTNADANAGLTNIWSKRLHELGANAVTEK